ncbi:hypothetical protein T492DRAFT_876610 [Pavlovales sp. CCMP2436]|nr:hypothetical protein T492DRAFT_876610 [Pavlovales sp. CCMP2436]
MCNVLAADLGESRALLVAALALCEAATGMRSLTVRSSAVSASRVGALRMESPLPPPQADSLSLGGSAAPDPTPTPSSAPPPSASLEDKAFSMFGSDEGALELDYEGRPCGVTGPLDLRPLRPMW